MFSAILCRRCGELGGTNHLETKTSSERDNHNGWTGGWQGSHGRAGEELQLIKETLLKLSKLTIPHNLTHTWLLISDDQINPNTIPKTTTKDPLHNAMRLLCTIEPSMSPLLRPLRPKQGLPKSALQAPAVLEKNEATRQHRHRA